ncbi:hypothetical protein [Paenibacillus agricola]|uniref:Uncharacterized protein n=1 Tax=Paenibacillus agricola TaxID=2716264 RepID=A0ABX0JAP9_9BACL|nr:hypothetical protein [Paenibacillus agricola]NHN33562.1 hypothetical protein [Paenibacillus agricola]
MTTAQLNFLSEEVPAYLIDNVRQGYATASFRLMLQQLEAYNDFEDETPDEIERIKAIALEGFKRQLAEAISQNNAHCGKPVNVAGTYSFETSEHTMLVSCSICGAYHEIKPAPATTNSESGQALNPMTL